MSNKSGIISKLTTNFAKLIDKDLNIISAAFQNSNEAFAIEADGKIEFVNPAFLSLFKIINETEILGNPFSKLILTETEILRISELRKSNSIQKDVFETLCSNFNGESFSAEICVSRFEAADQSYLLFNCKNISEQKQKIEKLEHSNESYAKINENIDDVLWRVEVKNNFLKFDFITNQIEKISGYKAEDFYNSAKLFFKIVHESDFILVKKKFQNLFNDSARFSEEIDHRVITKPGAVIWVRNKIRVIRDENGKVISAFGVLSDISLSKRAEANLLRNIKKLKELNSAKDKFISIISHDLRTPFSSITGFTEILLSDDEIDETQRIEYINFIKDSSQNILSLVNSLLDWTRIQTGRIRFEPEKLNLREVVLKAITLLNGTAIQKGIALKSDISKEIFVHADFNLMLQIFNNLISNSIKFTNTGGVISVLLKTSGENNQVEIVVKDSGTGIKKENLDKLFKVDAKFTSEGTAGEKGTGLGLSIVQEIVIKHGGKIWVESEIGNGTEFHFTLPLAAESILLVDDSKTDRLLYSKILKNFIPLYNIDEAKDGSEALEKIKKSSPALVITDHKMLEISGYDLVKKIKVSDFNRKPPVIVLSSDVNDYIVDAYKELEVEYVFQKPVNLVSFKEAVDRSLKKAVIS